MEKHLNRSFQYFFIIIMITFLLNACSTMTHQAPDQASMTPEEALRLRVEGLMNARVHDDWGQVYDYFASSYRKNVSKDGFVHRNREMRYVKYTIDSIQIEPSGTEATVKVKSSVKVKSFDFNDIPETQHWIKEDGNWFEQVDVSKKPM